MLNLKEFTPKRRGSEQARVTISSNKPRIVFNSKANELLGSARYVKIYYGEEDKVIGIEPHKEKDKACYKITETRNGTKFLTTKSFFKKYNLYHEETTSYPMKWNEEEGMLIVNLRERVAQTLCV